MAVTPVGRSPSTVIAMERGLGWGSVWVARTCSTSEVPIPNARAPNAPWVDVWESPHTMVMPGWVTPCSGPMTWTIPWRGSSSPYSVTLELLAVGHQGVDLLLGEGISDSEGPACGGHAVVDGGQGQVRPAHRPAGHPETVEGLGGGDLVDQVQVDVEQGGFAFGLPHQMAVPNLLEEGLRCGHVLQGRAAAKG